MKGIKNIFTKERLDAVTGVVKKVSEYAVPILGMVLFTNTVTDKLETMRYNIGVVKYDDAVRAIMNSSMWSEDKSKAVALLRKDGGSGFYKAVVNVVQSSMWSKDKLKTIQDMCKDDEVVSEEES